MEIIKPGIWATATYRREALVLHAQCWTLDEKKSEAPGAPTLIGACVLKVLHVVLGGDPTRASDLVAAGAHAVFAFGAGTVEKMDVWPTKTDAVDVWERAWPEILNELRKTLGVFGRIEEPSPGVIEVAYGPGAAMLTAIAPPPPLLENELVPAPTGVDAPGRVVSLSAKLTRPKGELVID